MTTLTLTRDYLQQQQVEASIRARIMEYEDDEDGMLTALGDVVPPVGLLVDQQNEAYQWVRSEEEAVAEAVAKHRQEWAEVEARFDDSMDRMMSSKMRRSQKEKKKLKLLYSREYFIRRHLMRLRIDVNEHKLPGRAYELIRGTVSAKLRVTKAWRELAEALARAA